MEAEINQILDRIYNDPGNAGGFAGVDQLWVEARKLDRRIRKKDVRAYLEGHRTYTLHRPRRIHFKRSRLRSTGYLSDMHCDLADLQKFSRKNHGNKYILVGVDVLSRRLFATPVSSKSPHFMKQAFDRLLEQMEMHPLRLFTDKGNEFCAKEMKRYFEEKEIEKFQANASTVKASLAERHIRTLKQRIYRYMSEKQTLNWVDVLDQIVDAINHSKCRPLGGLRPVDVNFQNAEEIWRMTYGEEGELVKPVPGKQTRYQLGQHVRMSKNKGPFAKGYLPNYHDEILTVSKPKAGRPVDRYKVKDERGEPFAGYFYTEELAPVRKDENTTYRIEKRLRTKIDKTDGTKRYLVKFFDDPIPQWIEENQLVPL
jgi:hypothetical protein